MSLHRHSTALIEQGWIRALILLVVYVSLSVLWGYYVWSPELWFAVSFVLSFLLVFLCRRLIDRKSFESLGFNTAFIYPDAVIGFSLGTLMVCTGALVLYYLCHRWASQRRTGLKNASCVAHHRRAQRRRTDVAAGSERDCLGRTALPR